MSIMNFLIADVVQIVSGTMTTFSQGDGAKIRSDMTQSVDIYKLSVMDLYHLIQPHSVNGSRRVQLAV